jgi:NifU-like protein
MAFYPEAVNQLFLNPLNPGVVEKTTARGRAASFSCGAALLLTIRVETPSYRVADAKFQAAGCGYLIAAASVLTEIIQGLKLAEAEAVAGVPDLCETTIAKHFGGVPETRRQCLSLCREALQDAIQNYRQAALIEWTGGESVICVCFSVTEETIRQTIETGALQTVAEVTQACNAGAGCGSCRSLVQDMLDRHCGETA